MDCTGSVVCNTQHPSHAFQCTALLAMAELFVAVCLLQYVNPYTTHRACGARQTNIAAVQLCQHTEPSTLRAFTGGAAAQHVGWVRRLTIKRRYKTRGIDQNVRYSAAAGRERWARCCVDNNKTRPP